MLIADILLVISQELERLSDWFGRQQERVWERVPYKRQ
jgi:hypothetical protein